MKDILAKILFAHAEKNTRRGFIMVDLLDEECHTFDFILN